MSGWGEDPYGEGGAGGLVDLQNLSFEAPGGHCGLPEGWLLAYTVSTQNLAGFGPECLLAWETFSRGWSSNESYTYTFSGTAANYNSDNIYVADTAYESFEGAWVANESYQYTLENPNPATFDATEDEYEDFEEEWNNSSYVYSFSGTGATFDSEAAEDFEEEWASNETYVFTFSGANSQFHSVTMRALHGVSHTDVWAVGASGTALHWDGVSWSSEPTGTEETLYGVWAVASDDVWAVGANGTILHWDGFQFNLVDAGEHANNFYAVSAAGGRVYVVGSSGKILEWDGTTFTVRTSGVTQALYAVYATSTSDVMAVGNNGVATRWNGSVWTASATGVTVPLNGVTKLGVNYYAVGNNGTIRKFNGSVWSGVTSGTSEHLYAVSHDGTDIYVVGANNTIRKDDPPVAFSPLPSNTKTLRGVLAINASTSLWVAGEFGASFFYNGSAWSTTSSANSIITTSEDFERLWVEVEDI